MSEPDTATASVTLPESDTELIARLRSGDNTAYETLWQRHVGAALRLGRRIAPGDAADLVSEAFLAVYDRIRVQGAGPDTHFRAYLFTTMRNMAVRMHAARNRIELDPDIEVVDERSSAAPPRRGRCPAAPALISLLPVRWQRVLWLSEVAGVARPAIARELRIRPNAVSALHRRAKAAAHHVDARAPSARAPR
jgi:RNA polymerase sigma factor (sigma-70 family)